MTRASAAAGAALPEPAGLSIGALASAITASAAALEKVGPIEEAYPDWLAKMRALDEASEARVAIQKKYVEPERYPWHPFRDEGGHITVPGDRPGQYRCYLDESDSNVAELRSRIACKKVEGWDDFQLKVRAESAQKTLDKILAWRNERDRRREAIGLPAAEEHERRLESVADEETKRLLSITPATYKEAAFQAAILDVDWVDVGATHLVINLRKLAGIAPYWPEIDGEA